MTKFKLTMLTLVLFSSFNMNSQEKKEEKGFTVTGSVDVYHTSNFKSGSPGSIGILYAGSAAANGFGLGMVNTVFSYKSGKSGVVADLAYGPRANAANAYEGAINQLYAFYKASDKVTLTLGQFNTFYGYEVISPSGNFNYSVSYLFNAGPFSHTGFKLDYAVSDDLSFMLALTNPHGITSGANPGNDYQYGFQTGYKGQFFNLAYGADGFGFTDVLYLDYTGGLDLSDSFFLGINAALADNDGEGFYGAALYPQFGLSEDFTLGLRGEYFSTKSDIIDESSVFSATVTGSYTVENLTIKPEFRLDTWGDAKHYVDADGVLADNLSSFLVAAIYSF